MLFESTIRSYPRPIEEPKHGGGQLRDSGERIIGVLHRKHVIHRDISPDNLMLPAGVIMIALGHIWEGIFIISVGAGVISVIDNILRPKLVGKDTEMHPLLVFFATLGGLSLFGLSGFVIGPIIVALFMALSEIYSIEFRDQLKEYNQ